MKLDFSDVAIYLHRDYVDFRKQINGLSIIVSEQMGYDVFSSSIYVFCNKRRDKLKILYWDSTGFCLWHKRLEQEKFKWPKRTDELVTVTGEQMNWLLDGYDITRMTPHKKLHYDSLY